MTTYTQQFDEDEKRIEDNRLPPDLAMAHKSGRFRALAHYYATCADYHAAQVQKLRGRSADTLVREYLARTGAVQSLIAELLLAIRKRLDPQEHPTVLAYIDEAHDLLQWEAGEDRRREEEDLDSDAATESDIEYDRRKDDDLLGEVPMVDRT